MITSIIFVIAFIIFVMFGAGVENWRDCFFGMIFGISIVRITLHFTNYKNI